MNSSGRFLNFQRSEHSPHVFFVQHPDFFHLWQEKKTTQHISHNPPFLHLGGWKRRGFPDVKTSKTSNQPENPSTSPKHPLTKDENI